MSLKVLRRSCRCFLVIGVSLLCSGVARLSAATLPPGAVPLAMVFDEKGNGGIGMRVSFPGGTDIEVFEIPSTLDPLQPPSTPGLQYHPEFDGISATTGDVLLLDTTGGISDLIRFNGDGSINFYSVPDAPGKFDGLADNSAFPTFFLPNLVTLPETYPGPDLGAKYIPAPGQPGFSPFLGTVPYYFISEKPWPAGSIPEDKALLAPFLVDPEPSTYSLLLFASPILAWCRRRRKSGVAAK